MNTPVKIVLVALGIAGAALLLSRAASRTEGKPVVAIEQPARAPAEPASRGLSASEALSTSSRSEIEPARAGAVADAATAAAATATLTGRVLDEHGRPRAGVTVAFRPRGQDAFTTRAVSAPEGTFEMTLPGEGGSLEADDPALVTIFAGSVGGSPAATPVIVVADATQLQGFVVDAEGIPVEGALVRIECPEELRTRIAANLDHSVAQHWSVRSDARGAYAFEALPRVPDARLDCTHGGFAPFVLPLGDVLGGPFVITLLRPGAEQEVVRGRVVDADGAPVEGAWVAFGVETTKSDERGAFAMRRNDPRGMNARLGVKPVRLVATKKGFLPGELEAPVVDGETRWPQYVTLRLGQPALAIAGIVRDHLGRERAGVRVFVADPSLFGEVGGRPTQVESLIAGVTDRSWNFVETDEHGAFTIEGLCARAYTVRAMEPETLLRVDVEDVQAGTTGLIVALPRDALYPRVAGRVLTHDGQPVAGAHVYPMCDAFQARLAGRIVSTSHDALDGVVTDDEGRFEILDVPKSLVYLRVEREDVLPLEYCRYVPGDERFTDTPRELPVDRIESLDIRVDRRAHVQVEVGDPALADEFALLDEKGRPLELSVFVGNGRREGRRAPIVDGHSYVTAGTDRAKTLVLYQGEAEVARRGVELTPGETTTIRW